MKQLLYIFLSLMLLSMLLAFSTLKSSVPIEKFEVLNGSSEAVTTEDSIKITLTIGNDIFSAKLHDNASTHTLIAQFPLTLTMQDLNGNEKFGYIADALPTNSETLEQINSGDIMLYGNDCLVLFYERLSSNFSYTKLGSIDDAADFALAVESDEVQVTFAM